jgi:hypothetical protein
MAHPNSNSRSSMTLVDETKGATKKKAIRSTKKNQFNNANANDETLFNNLPNVFPRSG